MKDFSLKCRSKIITSAYAEWIDPSSKVLDIGCGNGVIDEELINFFHCSIIGTDVMDYRKRELPFVLMSEQDKLPFNDKEFDICMFNDALHHCNNQEGLLNEAMRVADKILLFEMEPTIIAKILDVAINQIHNPRMNIPLNIRTLQEWRDYFEKRNLDFEYRRIKTPFLYPFKNYAIRLKK